MTADKRVSALAWRFGLRYDEAQKLMDLRELAREYRRAKDPAKDSANK